MDDIELILLVIHVLSGKDMSTVQYTPSMFGLLQRHCTDLETQILNLTSENERLTVEMMFYRKLYDKLNLKYTHVIEKYVTLQDIKLKNLNSPVDQGNIPSHVSPNEDTGQSK
jgi:hypothetical protein